MYIQYSSTKVFSVPKMREKNFETENFSSRLERKLSLNFGVISDTNIYIQLGYRNRCQYKHKYKYI